MGSTQNGESNPGSECSLTEFLILPHGRRLTCDSSSTYICIHDAAEAREGSSILNVSCVFASHVQVCAFVEFKYLVFPRMIMAGESCHNRFRSVLCSRDVFRALQYNTIQYNFIVSV